jgi:hypothetical protein
MDLDMARAELELALRSPGADDDSRQRAARTVLIAHGSGFCPDASGLRTLEEVIQAAAASPRSKARTDFAVLLVHAFANAGVLPARGAAEAAIRSFLESTLRNALRRAGYPFDATPYDRRQALARLHMTIGEHLRPLEPTFPGWIRGDALPDEP